MNTNEHVDINTPTDEIVEVPALKDDATEDEKAEYYANIESSNKQLFARLKKAQGFELKDGTWVKKEAAQKPAEQPTNKTSKQDLSQADIFTLVKADVHQEDIAEIQDYATLKGVSIAEALATPFMKGILADKAEQRRIADGTHTNDGSARNSGKVSDETLIANAQKGVMPDNDADLERLITLRREANR